MTTLEQYQNFTKTTAIYPDANTGNLGELVYLSLGLAGEAGEIANKVKKLYRDGMDPMKIYEVSTEVGDVFWYLVRLCDALGLDADRIIAGNIDKLSSRKSRGTLGGSGDNR